jgi:hypothetical protein
MSDGKDGLLSSGDLVGFQGRVHFDAVVQGGRQWLLAHDVQSAEPGKRDDHFAVHLVQHADEDSVDAGGDVLPTAFDTGPASRLVGDEITPVGKGGALGWRGLRAPYHGLTEAVPLVVVRLGNSDDHAVGCRCHGCGISPPSRARADD